MVERKCPRCGKRVFSADTINDWYCPYCGANIPRF